MNLRPIQTALVSCTDKSGLKKLCEALHRRGTHLVSTGGTGAMLRTWGIPFEEISSFTGHPEAFQGRMKTISFACASALLFRRESPADTVEAAQLGIRPIDLVVCNLYPFEQTAREKAAEADLMEQIDIGGPLMIRAAAKNFLAVNVLSDPAQYLGFLQEYNAQNGQTSLSLRKRLALEAFERIAAYDVAIATELGTRFDTQARPVRFLALKEGRTLRYGENPHQPARLYAWDNGETASLAQADSLQGKAMSYNNMLDADAAWKTVSDVAGLFQGGTACAVIKHGNPCGLVHAMDATTALERAWAGDPVSAFGGIVALTSVVEAPQAKFFHDKFVEIIMAPSFSPEARNILAAKKNLRLLELPVRPAGMSEETLRSFAGGVLWQEEDTKLNTEFRPVTKASFPVNSETLVTFGTVAAKHLKSNAIALVRVKDGVHELAGAGMGQPNRIDSFLRLALPRLKEKDFTVSEAVLVSDAFFPFADTVSVAAEAGVRFIVQPGGSIKDDEVIAEADRRGIAMVFTGERHFRH